MENNKINQSIWFQDLKKYPKVTKEINCDVLIVGGGLSGLSTGYYLSKKKQKVVVVDKNMIGSGTSGHTSAHVTLQHDLIYHHYIKEFGLSIAKRIALANKEAIDEIKKIVNEEKIECDLRSEDSYLVSNLKSNFKKLDQEYQAYQKLNIDSEIVENVKGVKEYLKGLVVYKQLHFNPVKYLNGLAEAIIRNNGEIYQNYHVLNIKENYADNNQYRINFKSLVIATHNPIINFPGLYFTKVYQDRSYTASIQNLNVKGMFNEIDKDGLTFRNYTNDLLIGGKDHKCASKIKINHSKELMQKINSIIDKPKYSNIWHAQDGITIDSLPYIGKYTKNSKNIYVITGFGKWGMTNSNIAGRIITDLITKSVSSYISIYSPQRKKSIKSKWNLTLFNFSTMTSLIGGLVRIKNPKCSHLKCRTKYNKYTNSYDCPCHGSRFNEQGEVIDSPANKKIL